MSVSESGIGHHDHWGLAVNLKQLAGGLSTIAGGGVLAVATSALWPAVVSGACGVIYAGIMLVKSLVDRDGRHKDERIKDLERRLRTASDREGG
jgi:hypothetical protein